MVWPVEVVIFNPGKPSATACTGRSFRSGADGWGLSEASEVELGTVIPVSGLSSGPAKSNWDIALAKTTKVGGVREGATLEFRSEFFNAFNHPQFSNPTAVVTSATFGKIGSMSVNPRLIQFALKYSF